jgi:hypothetical protein
MFVQVIQGKVSDPAGLRKQFDRWQEEVAPGARGALGSTAGVTDDRRFIAIARFESEEAARTNSERPEQGKWFEETSQYFEGAPTFHDCTDVQTWLGGGSDDASFVQVIQGKVRDVDRMKELIKASESDLRQNRTAVIGGLVAYHGDGGFTQTVYFTSEREAREQERARPAEADERIQELRSLSDGEPAYFDLRDPWFYST